MPTKSGSWFRQKEEILKKKNLQHHLLWAISGKISWMFCLPALGVLGCPAELWAGISFLMEKPPHTFCHLGSFGSESTLHLWVSNTQFPHKALSNSGNTKKGRRSVPSSCQTRPLCLQVHMPGNKTITHKPDFNKIHLQCNSDANVHCGRTNNRFVWAERFFLWFIQF